MFASAESVSEARAGTIAELERALDVAQRKSTELELSLGELQAQHVELGSRLEQVSHERDEALTVGHHDEPGQHGRHLHPGEPAAARGGVAYLDGQAQ